MWKLSIVDDQGQKTSVNLVRDQYSIGRAEGNTIRLTERNISRRHALIRQTSTGYMIEDLGSYNGLYVNGVRVISHQELAHQDLIQLGDYRVAVIDEDLATQEQGHQPYSGSVAPASGHLAHRLVVLIGPKQGAEFPLESERLLLGRGDECDIFLDHASVSRVHAEVRRIQENLFEIIDKGSANGLRINGRELPRALLDSRDVVELGDVVLKYIPQGQIFRVSPTEGQHLAAWGRLEPPAPEPVPQSRSLLAAVGGACVAFLLALFWFTFCRSPEPVLSPEETALTSPTERNLSPEQILSEAQRLVQEEQWTEAHTLLQTIPREDPARRSPIFHALEADWALHLLEAAQTEEDQAQRRNMLQQIAHAESVPGELRKQAFDLLQEQNKPGLELNELQPSAKKKPPSSPQKKR